MSRVAPPREGREAGRGGTRRHRRSKRSNNAEPDVTDQVPFRKRRLVRVRYCLDRSEWDWLYWHSLINEGGA